jgi:multicomponent K+:H+ antiporter subunit D
MSAHLVSLPVLIPLAMAALLIALSVERLPAQRALSIASCVAQLAVAAALLASSTSGEVHVYSLGGWPAPFGIVLVADRLAALMLTLTAIVAIAAVAYAAGGWDARGRYFHPIIQFQLAGLNGAFLTGDLFNLFVFFEILLIASYCLLVHGLGAARLRAALHYVVVNLAASALFLVAVSLLYGVTGTLNMADLAVRVAEAQPLNFAPIASAALLLLVVFGVKAAAFPLYFWLPGAYAAAAAPVAALFAIMTKVGIYAIIRVHGQVFGPDAGLLSLVAAPWLVPVALATIVLGVLGAVAARTLTGLVAYLTVASAGTTLAAVGLLTAEGLSAAIFYMAQSTLAIAAFFLLVELIVAQRGDAEDTLEVGRPMAQSALLGALFLVAGMTAVGMPPFAGFLGKLMILQAARETAAGAWIWIALLGTGLAALVSVARAGSAVFWRVLPGSPAGAIARPVALVPAVALAAVGVAMVAFAAPLKSFADAAAAQILDRGAYVEAILGPPQGVRQ